MKARSKIDALLLLIVLPLLGLVLAGKASPEYLEFPPLTKYVEHAPFSWGAFFILALGVTVVVFPFEFRVFKWRQSVDKKPSSVCSFPWWGWLGILLSALTWFFAWNRYTWFASLQVYTFTPLWLGYILTVNALTYKHTGKCMLTDRPRYLAWLFLISAGFWWFFEYLNRFVQNWYYVGIEDFSGLRYFIHATLPFSTVLPAVLGTYELLDSYPRIGAGLDHFIRVDYIHNKIFGGVLLFVFSVGLALVGVYPDFLFPLLWLAPLGVIVGLQMLEGRETILTPIKKGNWRRLYILAISALICGFLWELWNYKSVAKWIYCVPFVGKFKVFEMPILGYAGYLPFGIECAVIADMFLEKSRKLKTESGNSAAENTEGEWGNSLAKTLSKQRRERKARRVKAVIYVMIAFYFFIIPAITITRYVIDEKLRTDDVPTIAWTTHRNITAHYGNWARKRIASGRAANLYLYDVPATEWPIFGSVYYLWATEALQGDWEKKGGKPSKKAPAVYAKDTIEACMDLVMDPAHHNWVKEHWGEDYMHRENVFFRSLIIAAITSYENLLHEGKYLDVLRDQIETLSAELAASPLGVLHDYPGECYPIDVMAAIAIIQRADKVLGTDHSEFVTKAVRGFEDRMVDKHGLIPYLVDPVSGDQFYPSRGVGNSYVLIFAPEVWPEKARDWYKAYYEHFWQDLWWAAGFREFSKSHKGDKFTYDVDAGFIVADFSPAACAFGMAASKANGRMDHAYKLSSQVISACWPLLDGTLLGPRILSVAAGRTHAPYLGEACILFFLTQRAVKGVDIVEAGRPGPAYFVGQVLLLGIGVIILGQAYMCWKGLTLRIVFTRRRIRTDSAQ